MFDSNQLETVLNNRCWLKILPKEQRRAWEQTQHHSNKIAHYNAYVNRVCLYTILNWLKDWLAKESVSQSPILPSEDSLSSILEVVNGAAIGLGERRIVVIPSEDVDLEELCVPQEWVDIPNWAVDYYLAVLVNLESDEDDCWIKVCGFTTHRQLKNFGRYNDRDRTYVLAAENLTVNLTIMQVMMGLQMREEIPQLPVLSAIDAQKLIAMLSDASIYLPRLRVDIPFEQWAALLNNEEWRQQLYHRRIGQLLTKSTAKANNLSKWFQNNFDNNWQSLKTLINQESGNLVYSFRHHEPTTISVSVEGVKLIDFGMQLGNQSVTLLVGLTSETKGKIAIRVQLHPAKGQTYLPANIKLALVSQSGTILQEFQSRTQDNFIQLKRFTCSPGKYFKIQVALDNCSITEEFVIEPLVSIQQ